MVLLNLKPKPEEFELDVDVSTRPVTMVSTARFK